MLLPVSNSLIWLQNNIYTYITEFHYFDEQPQELFELSKADQEQVKTI